jgi:ADP-ribose 1''-phosphate phosphatase
MLDIEYVDGDLFSKAPAGAFLAHACNCQGSWGAGIAAQFKSKYPKDYVEYLNDCRKTSPGDALITKNKIICLYTSLGFGSRVDPRKVILKNTKVSLENLRYELPFNAAVYSNKFNSGLFGVPWEETEVLILDFLKKRPDIEWVVVSND